ncbi:MAG: aldehyde dehydrogenase family protein, partial [Solirubrobacterales bacterium]|nr:aldehyde dehydrogenase family protein [Solirubrobacterales bacterium]
MPSTFNAVDPATGVPGAGYDEASAAEVAAAVDAAQRAFRDPTLRDRDARAALLRGAAARLRNAGDEIVAVAASETGLPEGRLRGELERTAGQLEA